MTAGLCRTLPPRAYAHTRPPLHPLHPTIPTTFPTPMLCPFLLVSMYMCPCACFRRYVWTLRPTVMSASSIEIRLPLAEGCLHFVELEVISYRTATRFSRVSDFICSVPSSSPSYPIQPRPTPSPPSSSPSYPIQPRPTPFTQRQAPHAAPVHTQSSGVSSLSACVA